MENNDFRTFSEYMKNNSLTASMEDYLEMIYRLSLNTGFTRIIELSEALNVQPPSATKMVQKLGELKLIKYEKYGVLILEKKGILLGEFLLKRHFVIEALLRNLGVSEQELLQETEKAEHTFCDDTILCIQLFIDFMKENPDVTERYNTFRKRKTGDNAKRE